MWWLLLNAAVVGAHVQNGGEHFRQRDIRFLMDLFWNWQTSPIARERLEKVHNNQIKRALHTLTQEGFAQEIGQSKTYRVTRSGLIHGVTEIRREGLEGSFECFLFARFFFARYHGHIAGLVEKNGSPLPLSFRMEIKDLFDVTKFEREKKSRLHSEISYYRARISETQAAVDFVRRELKKGAKLKDIAAEMERKYPYELNAQKPLTQLLAAAPIELQRSEITDGNETRIELLWKAHLALLESQVKQLV